MSGCVNNEGNAQIGRIKNQVPSKPLHLHCIQGQEISLLCLSYLFWQIQIQNHENKCQLGRVGQSTTQWWILRCVAWTFPPTPLKNALCSFERRKKRFKIWLKILITFYNFLSCGGAMVFPFCILSSLILLPNIISSKEVEVTSPPHHFLWEVSNYPLTKSLGGPHF